MSGEEVLVVWAARGDLHIFGLFSETGKDIIMPDLRNTNESTSWWYWWETHVGRSGGTSGGTG